MIRNVVTIITWWVFTFDKHNTHSYNYYETFSYFGRKKQNKTLTLV